MGPHRLAAARRHFKLTQKEVGEAIGVTASQVCNLEADRSQPMASQLDAPASPLGGTKHHSTLLHGPY